MCLKPVKIRVPYNKIALQGGQPLQMEVPCGSCAECKKHKRLEWHFRTYYQCEDCVNNGGFIYYDTLTYSEENVPHLSDFVELPDIVHDFTCFNATHWRNFLKNLRRQLYYHYKGAVNFKYFLTSEYGTDPRYTHRPHYHILFFVNSKNIDPYDFSSLVSKCWEYGRTDGLPYQTRSYVADNIFGLDLGTNKDNRNYLKVCGYIAKYINKDSTFQENIDKRLSLLKGLVDDDTFKKVSREISMFHRQSQGFGALYLNMSDDEREFVKNNNACRIFDAEEVVLVIPLPLYYKRKLFYTCVKLEDGKLTWQPTYDGVQHIRHNALKSIKKVERIYNTIYVNARDIEKRVIDSILGERTLEDYAIYKLFYQGRSRELTPTTLHNLMQSTRLTDTEYNFYDWVEIILHSKFVNTFDDDMVLYRSLDTDTLDIPSFGGNMFDLYNSIPYTNNLKNLTFSEHSCIAFKDFDKLTAVFNGITKNDKKQSQNYYDFVEELIKKFNVIYYGYKN